MKIATIAEMRELERLADERYGLDSPTLMERAGARVAELARARCGGTVDGVAIVLLAGPGNNGGDGKVAARQLREWGAEITTLLIKEQRIELAAGAEPEGDGLAAFRAELGRAELVIDAVLGTGHARPLDDFTREAFALVEAERRRRPALWVLAVDLPSGVNADTGEADPGTLRADMTLTLANPKVGLLAFPAADYVGELEVGDIGIPAALSAGLTLDQLTATVIRPLLPARPLDSNKGTFGKVMVLAGSLPYPGAAYLATSAAGRAGAGLVTLAVTPDLAPIYAARQAEITLHLLPAESEQPLEQRAQGLLAGLRGYRALLVGPGLGQNKGTQLFLHTVFNRLRALPEEERPRLVVDADGLNALARLPEWWTLLPPGAVLTPHPGEMARLCGGRRVSGGGPERLALARDRAAAWGHTVVLKGACTVVAAPDGATALFWPPNPALATAGTGDVLAGTIAGLLAQGLEPVAAARVGVYLHGQAGLLAREVFGVAGVVAGDLLPQLPVAQQQARDS
ncbi:MAG TPA: NAD(P)H-hydrate dehydratase [Ktedonobacterales bacterium]|nr:NAD(P)H-hydrate dehydratase [Ktedonobacterales bacterium]